MANWISMCIFSNHVTNSNLLTLSLFRHKTFWRHCTITAVFPYLDNILHWNVIIVRLKMLMTSILIPKWQIQDDGWHSTWESHLAVNFLLTMRLILHEMVTRLLSFREVFIFLVFSGHFESQFTECIDIPQQIAKIIYNRSPWLKRSIRI